MLSKLKQHHLLAKQCSNQDCAIFIKNTQKENCPVCGGALGNFFDLLSLLSLSANFTKKELQANYKKLTLFFHPDQGTGSSEDFIFLKDSYDLLKKEPESYLKNYFLFQEKKKSGNIIDEKNQSTNAHEEKSDQEKEPSKDKIDQDKTDDKAETEASPDTSKTTTKNPDTDPNATNQATEQAKQGWIKNNPFLFLNIFSGFVFGLILGLLIFYWTENSIIAFAIFSLSLTLGGIYAKAVFLFIILLEGLVIFFFASLIYQEKFFYSFLLLPLIYFLFHFLNKLYSKFE